MERLIGEINESLINARNYVLDGGEQILDGSLDETHNISPCPGATALASLALILLGDEYKTSHQAGIQWLQKNRQISGWSKVPNGETDKEITHLVKKVMLGSQGGFLTKFFLSSQAQDLSDIVLSLGQNVVPGIEGPLPEETHLPNILSDHVLQKLPPYGRPVVIAASILASRNINELGVSSAIEYLSKTQMKDGSWSEDIVATSLAIIALVRAQKTSQNIIKAGHWLKSKQYKNGAWPAFDQLYIWSTGLAIHTFMEFNRSSEEQNWINRAAKWLAKSQNSDGSYGSTPPFTQPDLDDTAVALMGLQHFDRRSASRSIELLRRLQNKDGSWSTFPSYEGIPPTLECTFPVYIPSTDVTIHVLDVLWATSAWSGSSDVFNGLNWLLEKQLPTGEVPAVWYEGPIYGTAQTLELLSRWNQSWSRWRTAGQIYNTQQKTFNYLLSLQNTDGSWGSSVIETALALSAISLSHFPVPTETLTKGIRSIISGQLPNGSYNPSYQGIYAKGWNYEEPLTTALCAIKAIERFKRFQYLGRI
ncbi:prenyltransferase/squalene oxidase repeat-containing protein [Desulfitobacterium sp. AusDCA]